MSSYFLDEHIVYCFPLSKRGTGDDCYLYDAEEWCPSGDVLVLSGHILKPFTSCSRVRVADSLGGSLGLGANSWRNMFTSSSTSSPSISAVLLRSLLQKSDSAV
eukprot:scaffold292961_cov59-Attheya_sp.AAC.1